MFINTKNISNITIYELKNVENPNPNRVLRCSICYCLHIYYLLIIAIPDSALQYKYYKIYFF